MSNISSAKRFTYESGRIELEFPILIQNNSRFICRTAYRKLHNIGKTQFQELIKRQQNGDKSVEEDLGDSTNYGKEMRKKIEKFCETHNINFNQTQIAAIQIQARSTVFKEMVFRLDDYFATCGEFMPTKGLILLLIYPICDILDPTKLSDGDSVQLELISKYEIYAMYKQDSLRYNLEHLSLQSFYKAFRAIFPFVHIRRKKASQVI